MRSAGANLSSRGALLTAGHPFKGIGEEPVPAEGGLGAGRAAGTGPKQPVRSRETTVVTPVHAVSTACKPRKAGKMTEAPKFVALLQQTDAGYVEEVYAYGPATPTFPWEVAGFVVVQHGPELRHTYGARCLRIDEAAALVQSAGTPNDGGAPNDGTCSHGSRDHHDAIVARLADVFGPKPPHASYTITVEEALGLLAGVPFKVQEDDTLCGVRPEDDATGQYVALSEASRGDGYVQIFLTDGEGDLVLCGHNESTGSALLEGPDALEIRNVIIAAAH